MINTNGEDMEDKRITVLNETNASLEVCNLYITDRTLTKEEMDARDKLVKTCISVLKSVGVFVSDGDIDDTLAELRETGEDSDEDDDFENEDSDEDDEESDMED